MLFKAAITTLNFADKRKHKMMTVKPKLSSVFRKNDQTFVKSAATETAIVCNRIVVFLFL